MLMKCTHTFTDYYTYINIWIVFIYRKEFDKYILRPHIKILLIDLSCR